MDDRLHLAHYAVHEAVHQRDEARERIVELEAQLRAEQMCDVCGGSGKPESGLKCICGGSGKTLDALQGYRNDCFNLREQLAERDARCAEMRAALSKIMECVDNMPCYTTVDPITRKVNKGDDFIPFAVWEQARVALSSDAGMEIIKELKAWKYSADEFGKQLDYYRREYDQARAEAAALYASLRDTAGTVMEQPRPEDWQPGPGIVSKLTLLTTKVIFAWMKKLVLVWWRK